MGSIEGDPGKISGILATVIQEELSPDEFDLPKY